MIKDRQWSSCQGRVSLGVDGISHTDWKIHLIPTAVRSKHRTGLRISHLRWEGAVERKPCAIRNPSSLLCLYFSFILFWCAVASNIPPWGFVSLLKVMAEKVQKKGLCAGQPSLGISKYLRFLAGLIGWLFASLNHDTTCNRRRGSC